MGVPCGGCGGPTCRLCFLARTDANYRLLWGLPPDPSLPPPSPPPPPAAADAAVSCAYRDDRRLSLPMAWSIGLPHPYRSWYRCDHPERPLAATAVGTDGRAYVCPCGGCGPGCGGYVADLPGAVAPWSDPVVVV